MQELESVPEKLTANFRPSKRFFVSMLTRDIELNDAILDLLDNCVDGALRNIDKASDMLLPYEGFNAKLTVNENYFIIEDNCGGIAKKDRDYAFRMGRPHHPDDENEGTVGVYGIGMKRAIFKMGNNCSIDSNHIDGAFEIDITSDWMLGDDWVIPISEKIFDSSKSTGTKILIDQLHSNISSKFSEKSYISDLYNQIKYSLSFIIQKGFKIILNDVVVKANPIKLISDGQHIEPYIYRADIDDVKIDLVVGFYTNIDDPESDDSTLSKRKSDNAGWTLICNDRVVLYCDKSHLTGWGFDNTPRFHAQYNAISGVVRFTSKNPEKLPITTTKRGVDLSSVLYNDVRNKMIEGMKIFIKFTNQWKGEHLEEGKKLLSKASFYDTDVYFSKDKDSVATAAGKWTNPNKNINERRFTPILPSPKEDKDRVRVTFFRHINEIKVLSNYFFGDENKSPSEVGIRCFESILKEVGE